MRCINATRLHRKSGGVGHPSFVTDQAVRFFFRAVRSRNHGNGCRGSLTAPPHFNRRTEDGALVTWAG